MSLGTFALISLGLVASHSAAWGWGWLIGDIGASDRVNREWILNEEWKRITATPWGAWMKNDRRKT